MSTKERLFRPRLRNVFEIKDPDGEVFKCKELNAAEESALFAALKKAEEDGGDQSQVISAALWLAYYLVDDVDTDKRAVEEGELEQLLKSYNVKELYGMSEQIVNHVMPKKESVEEKVKNSETQPENT